MSSLFVHPQSAIPLLLEEARLLTLQEIPWIQDGWQDKANSPISLQGEFLNIAQSDRSLLARGQISYTAAEDVTRAAILLQKEGLLALGDGIFIILLGLRGKKNGRNKEVLGIRGRGKEVLGDRGRRGDKGLGEAV